MVIDIVYLHNLTACDNKKRRTIAINDITPRITWFEFNITQQETNENVKQEFGKNVAITPMHLEKLKYSIPKDLGHGIRIMSSIPNDSNSLQLALEYLHRSIPWNLPHTIEMDKPVKVFDVDKTVCLLKNDMKNDIKFDVVATTTSESAPVQVTLKWKYVSDYFVNTTEKEKVSVPSNSNHTITVRNGSPELFYVDLTNKTGFWSIIVKSENKDDQDEICGKVSIHPLGCPVPEYDSVHQSMFKLGVLNINVDQYQNITVQNTTERGFLLQLHAFATNCTCNPKGKQFIETSLIELKANFRSFIL